MLFGLLELLLGDYLVTARLATGEAPTPSPKIISVSGAKSEPKKKPLFLACLRDDNLSLSNMLMKESKAFFFLEFGRKCSVARS